VRSSRRRAGFGRSQGPARALQAPRDIVDSPSRLAELRFQFSRGTFVSGALIGHPRPYLVELSRSLPFQLFCQLRRQGEEGITDSLCRAALLDLDFEQVFVDRRLGPCIANAARTASIDGCRP